MDGVELCGSADTILLVIRGNSGSGKSSVAQALRDGYGRGCALVGQDHFRRIVLRERDEPGGLAPLLIERTARVALDHGYHVIVEGILTAARYRATLTSLIAGHRGTTSVWYMDVPFEETLRRHATRPLASAFTAEQIRSWYAPGDILQVAGEQVVPADWSLEETVARIAAASGLPQTRRDEDYLPLAAGPTADA